VVQPQYTVGSYDKAISETGNYVTSRDNIVDIYYPFRTLFTGRRQEDLEFVVHDEA